MRRSLAIGGSLTRADCERLIDAVAVLLTERAVIERILGELGPSWAVCAGVERVSADLRVAGS